jgi:hypothetical protein
MEISQPPPILTIIDAAVVSGCYSLHPDMLDKAQGYALKPKDVTGHLSPVFSSQMDNSFHLGFDFRLATARKYWRMASPNV